MFNHNFNSLSSVNNNSYVDLTLVSHKNSQTTKNIIKICRMPLVDL